MLWRVFYPLNVQMLLYVKKMREYEQFIQIGFLGYDDVLLLLNRYINKAL